MADKVTKWANRTQKYYEKTGYPPDVERMRSNGSKVNLLVGRYRQVQKHKHMCETVKPVATELPKYYL